MALKFLEYRNFFQMKILNNIPTKNRKIQLFRLEPAKNGGFATKTEYITFENYTHDLFDKDIYHFFLKDNISNLTHHFIFYNKVIFLDFCHLII